MHDIVINWFVDFPKNWATFIIAMIPVTELRASIPLAIEVYKLNPFMAWLYSVSGTYFAMVLIVFLLDPISKALSHHVGFFNIFFKWLFQHTKKKNSKKVNKYGSWSIFILAAIPVPILGGLSGAVAAFVFRFPASKSLPLLLLGTMLSGGIILWLTIFLG
ncbi:MAG TPA: hypothetical protein DDY52_03215 [Candidatus Moranbacteria bacterium]|nr:hypothetical protein [Candidatus Moranbacteria bacterium]